MPHSAINLSVKTTEAADTASSSLDLSMGDGTAGGQQFYSNTSSLVAGNQQQQAHNNTLSSPQLLDLTRPGAPTSTLPMDRLSAPAAKKTDPSTTAKRDQSEPVDFTSNACSYNFTSTSSTTMAGVPTSSVLTESDSSVTDSLSRYKNSAAASKKMMALFRKRCHFKIFSYSLRLFLAGIHWLPHDRVLKLRTTELCCRSR